MKKNRHKGLKFRILSFLKAIIPISLLFRLRYLRLFFSPKTLEPLTRKRIYYLDAPDYANLGDQAIALAIRKYSEREFPEFEFVEVLQCEVVGYMQWIKRNIRPDDIIFLTGGGNMGNKYRMYEATRRYVIKNLPHNRVFIFPQSVDFTDDIFGRASMKTACSLYNLPNVQLFVREKISLNKICEAIPKTVLVPDIVLSLIIPDSMINVHQRTNIGVCLRNDMEGVLKASDQKTIMSFANTKTSNIVLELSTTPSISWITEQNREIIINELLADFCKCKLIITDRLHAMIFAVVTKTPCVVFDNKNHKIAGTYEFIKDNSAVVLINSIEQLNDAVDRVLNKSYELDQAHIHDIISNLVKATQYGSNS